MKLEKTNQISRRHFWFPREMTSEERAQKFHTDDVSLPRSEKWHVISTGFSSVLVSQMSFRGETSCGISKCRQFPQVNLLTVKMEQTMNTKNTATNARFILKWSVNLKKEKEKKIAVKYTTQLRNHQIKITYIQTT